MTRPHRSRRDWRKSSTVRIGCHAMSAVSCCITIATFSSIITRKQPSSSPHVNYKSYAACRRAPQTCRWRRACSSVNLPSSRTSIRSLKSSRSRTELKPSHGPTKTCSHNWVDQHIFSPQTRECAEVHIENMIKCPQSLLPHTQI